MLEKWLRELQASSRKANREVGQDKNEQELRGRRVRWRMSDYTEVTGILVELLFQSWLLSNSDSSHVTAHFETFSVFVGAEPGQIKSL